MVGERRMDWLNRDGRHVAADAAISRIDGAGQAVRSGLGLWIRSSGTGDNGLGRLGGMSGHASRVVVCHGPIVVVVWVVTSHAIECATAFGVATAPGDGRSLESEPERIGAR